MGSRNAQINIVCSPGGATVESQGWLSTVAPPGLQNLSTSHPPASSNTNHEYKQGIALTPTYGMGLSPDCRPGGAAAVRTKARGLPAFGGRGGLMGLGVGRRRTCGGFSTLPAASSAWAVISRPSTPSSSTSHSAKLGRVGLRLPAVDDHAADLVIVAASTRGPAPVRPNRRGGRA